MHKIEFETLEQVKTGNTVTGFFGSREETKEQWVKKSGEVVCGGAGDGGYVLLKFSESDWGFIDMDQSEDEDGVMEVGYKSKVGEWKDVRNVRIL